MQTLNFGVPETQSGVATRVLIFDVEGTLVDCVAQTLESWRETLADFGLSFSTGQLHVYSGMDGGEMLDLLLRGSKAHTLKDEILKEQGVRYREKFLPTVAPLPGIRPLFANARELGWRIGLATTCQPDELERYGTLVEAFDLVEGIACGQDVKRGKPHPDLYLLALQRLGVDARQAFAVGDTPYDAIAAAHAGLVGSIGVLTGGIPAAVIAVGRLLCRAGGGAPTRGRAPGAAAVAAIAGREIASGHSAQAQDRAR